MSLTKKYCRNSVKLIQNVLNRVLQKICGRRSNGNLLLTKATVFLARFALAPNHAELVESAALLESVAVFLATLGLAASCVS